ncbi:unnamed protein product [Auanema sp. JU1783]|nr:unnamed protein product [Auanema sp. JU1783]
MNRLAWYTPAESMEDILCQAGHVGIYDGDTKQTEFEQGTASITLHRIIWADSSDPDRRLILHHSLVKSFEKHHKSMFSRSLKVIIRLEPCPQGLVGPINSSQFDYIRLVFKGGGEEEFCRRYDEALKRKTWQRHSSGSSSSGSRNSHGQLRSLGVSGIERKLAENHQRTHESISLAFEDMSKLMESAKEMVGLSKGIAEKLRSRKGEISEDETVAFKSYLLSLGVSDPVTKSTYGTGSKYFEKLAEELIEILEEPLKNSGGMMTLPEVYCRVNRARGMELLSPEDVLSACKALENIKSKLELHRFPSGVLVVQLSSSSVDSTVDATSKFVRANGSCTANQLAQLEGITVVLARERLLAAEERAMVCRDDSIEGLLFYPNKFLDVEA